MEHQLLVNCDYKRQQSLKFPRSFKEESQGGGGLLRPPKCQAVGEGPLASRYQVGGLSLAPCAPEEQRPMRYEEALH